MAVAERRSADAIHETWNQLYSEYYQLALTTARQRVPNLADAEDAAQKTFMDVYEILARGQSVDNWSGMIRTIARRAAGKERSRAEQNVELQDRAVEDRQAQESAERKRQFQQAFSVLSEGEQRAVYYTLFEGLTAAEVGERLGTGTDSAKHLLTRGRAELAMEIVSRNDATTQQLTCDRPLSVVGRYLANRMAHEERAEFKTHLELCPRCQLTVERVRDFRGFVLLLLPAGLALARRDELFTRIQAQPVAARSGGLSPSRGLLGGSLLLLVVIGGVVVTVAHRPTAVPPAITVAACPTGKLGGFAYLDNGNVMYRSSPTSNPQVLDADGHADALLWSPDGTTLMYKVARDPSSVAGSLHAVHPDGGQVWSFGTDIEAFAISPDGSSIAALAQHIDSSGNWDGWTLYIGPPGGQLTPHVESALVVPGGPNWRDSPTGEPIVESNYVPVPGNYEGVFWFGTTIYIAQSGEFAGFDGSGNPASSGWGPLSSSLKAMIAGIGQPEGSAVRFTQRGVNLTASCASSSKPLVAGANFTQDSSNTLMLADDPANPRAGLAVESSDGATGGDIYLVSADGQAVPLTNDQASYLPVWQP